MGWKKNPFTGELDYYQGTDELDSTYVNVVGDTMTGTLTVNSTGSVGIATNKDIVITGGQKLILDGA